MVEGTLVIHEYGGHLKWHMPFLSLGNLEEKTTVVEQSVKMQMDYLIAASLVQVEGTPDCLPQVMSKTTTPFSILA